MAYIQRSSPASATGSPATATVSLPGTLAGTSIVVAIAQSGSGTRTYTVSDDVNGAYTSAIGNNPTSSRGAHAFYLHGNDGGTLTITVAANTGIAAFDVVAYEVSGLDTGASPVTSSMTDPSPSNLHPCSADSDSIDTVGAAFLVTATALDGNPSTEAKASGWDEGFRGTAGTRYFQRRDALTALTNERGLWSQTGTDRSGVSIIAAFPYVAGGSSAAYVTWFGR